MSKSLVFLGFDQWPVNKFPFRATILFVCFTLCEKLVRKVGPISSPPARPPQAEVFLCDTIKAKFGRFHEPSQIIDGTCSVSALAFYFKLSFLILLKTINVFVLKLNVVS